MRYFLTLILLLFSFSSSFAGTYWVDDDGAETVWASCQSASPMSGAAACTLATANSNAAAGDTVYFRAGTYAITGIGINPTNSGTSGNEITFSNYNSESVIFDGNDVNNSRGVYISADYIIVSGIELLDYHIPVQLNADSDYNEIRYLTIHDSAEGNVNLFGGITLKSNADNNWIHHNTVHTSGISGCGEGSDGIKIGETVSPNANNNTIEDNLIYAYGHAAASDWGFYNVWRNNVAHNNGWKAANIITGTATSGSTSTLIDTTKNFETESIEAGDTVHLSYNPSYYGTGTVTNVAGSTITFTRVGTLNFANGYQYVISKNGCTYAPSPSGENPDDAMYGHRNFVIGGDYSNGLATHTLFERNRAGHASTNPSNNGADGLTLEGRNNIVRYNMVFGNAGPGINLKTITLGRGAENKIYNNTIYKNGQSVIDDSSAPHPAVGFYQYGATAIDNIIKNNIIYDNGSGYNYWHNNNGVYKGTITAQTWGANICDSTTVDLGCINSDPLFTDTTMSDMTSQTAPTLEISASSPAYDAGTYLTQASGAGSTSITLIVDDATFFQAGSSAATTPTGSALSSVAGDFIAIGTVGNTVQISDINYTTNTITLAGAMTWADNANIWLYKDSSGEIVLQGAAPDIGAFEVGSAGTVAGTITADSMTESTLVSGGATIDITIVNDTLEASIDAYRAEFIASCVSEIAAGTLPNGWNAEIVADEVVTAITRESDTLLRWTLSANANYSIDQNDGDITCYIPNEMLVTATEDVVPTPTFFISNENPASLSPQTGGVYSASGQAGQYSASGATVQ